MTKSWPRRVYNGREHIVANRFIAEIPEELKPEGGSEIDEPNG